MSAAPSFPPSNPAAWAQAALRRQVEVLEQLSEAGLELALAIKTRATQSEAPPAEAAMAFSRVARAVRMTGLLQSRLIQEMTQAPGRAAMDRLAYENLNASSISARKHDLGLMARARQDPAHDHKLRVEAVVARVARAQGDTPDRVDRLIREATERLDDDDIYGDVTSRPVGELVALICRDLGLDPDWERLAQEAWAVEEISQAPPGSPLASFSNHQGHQGHQEETPPEGSGVAECNTRLGVLGVLGGSILSTIPADAPFGASP